MSAKKSGGTGTRLKAKNQAMAAEMKRLGVERKVARCPVCNKIVALNGIATHINTCKG
jgi:hypothetical protein